MSKIATGLNLLMLSVTSGVLLYIIYQNRISGRRIDSLRETELATRITAEDVEEIVQMRVEAMVESLKKQRQMQQQQAQKNLDASKGSITGGCEEEKENQNQNQNPSVESSASPDPSTASPSRNE